MNQLQNRFRLENSQRDQLLRKWHEPLVYLSSRLNRNQLSHLLLRVGWQGSSFGDWSSREWLRKNKFSEGLAVKRRNRFRGGGSQVSWLLQQVKESFTTWPVDTMESSRVRLRMKWVGVIQIHKEATVSEENTLEQMIREVQGGKCRAALMDHRQGWGTHLRRDRWVECRALLSKLSFSSWIS